MEIEEASEKKLEAIKVLQSSRSFPKEGIYFRFLNYMVKEESAGNIVKSSTIAIDLLSDGNKTNGKLQDSYVRSKMLKLRKELNLFYLTEGKNEPYKISIPKGNYEVVLTPQTNEIPKTKKQRFFSVRMTFRLMAMVIILLVLFCTYLLYSNKNTKDEKSSFVSMFINKNAAVDIILGDRCFYMEYDSTLKRNRLIYDTDVLYPHRESLLYELKKKYPERKIFITNNFSHTDLGNILFAEQLTKEWFSKGQTSTIHFSSIKKEINHNTVFISKTSSSDLHGLLSSYFLNSKCEFSLEEQATGYIKSFHTKDEVYYFKTKASKVNKKKVVFSYCLLKKVISTKGHELLFVLPSNDGARKYITEKLFNTAFQKELLASFEDKEMDEFELLIQTQGLTYEKAQSHTILYNSVHDTD